MARITSPIDDAERTIDTKPTGIPDILWSAATVGDCDAQFYIGNMYSQGKEVPQDYAQAYFWYDISASGKSDTVLHEQIAKARDLAAARLTPSVLLQTQERALKWFTSHSPR